VLGRVRSGVEPRPEHSLRETAVQELSPAAAFLTISKIGSPVRLVACRWLGEDFIVVRSGVQDEAGCLDRAV
jgi:hypothetical protein